VLSHLLHHHLEFQLLVIGLCLVAAILGFYVFIGMNERRRKPVEKYSAMLIMAISTPKSLRNTLPDCSQVLEQSYHTKGKP
jgi:uncharacterized protein (UPF0333 family)